MSVTQLPRDSGWTALMDRGRCLQPESADDQNTEPLLSDAESCSELTRIHVIHVCFVCFSSITHTHLIINNSTGHECNILKDFLLCEFSLNKSINSQTEHSS